jgi:hypothetical protein
VWHVAPLNTESGGSSDSFGMSGYCNLIRGEILAEGCAASFVAVGYDDDVDGSAL